MRDQPMRDQPMREQVTKESPVVTSEREYPLLSSEGESK